MDAALLHCHHYKRLVRRWRSVARAAGMKMSVFAHASGYEVFMLTSRQSPEGGVYLSAGIHGDEPAGTEGLIRWAENNPGVLRKLPCVIFPCLNPWGLVNNSRLDENARDLNRTFQHDHVPHIQALKAFIKPYRFTLALNLHEDYDGQGLYLYELERRTPFWGEELLEMARPLMPIEGRTTIDNRRASKAGLLRRKIAIKKLPAIPEAFYLHVLHAERTFTFETPSEFALEERVRVQEALVEECVRRTLSADLYRGRCSRAANRALQGTRR